MRPEELLKKFLRRNISNQEKHLLERMSLDDHLLGDALEGIEEFGIDQVNEKLTQLASRLKTGENKKRQGLIRRLWPVAIAASIVLAIGILFWPQMTSFDQTDAPTATLFEETEQPLIKDAAAELALEDHQNLLEKLSETTDLPPSTNQKSSEPKISESIVEKEEERYVTTDKSIQTPMPPSETDIKISDSPTLALTDVENEIAQIEPPAQEGAGPAASRRQSVTKADFPEIFQPLALKNPIDTSGGYPTLGFDHVRRLNVEWRNQIKPDLFMRGIRSGQRMDVQFNTDQEGQPIDITVKGLKDEFLFEKIRSFILSTGTWVQLVPDIPITYKIIF